MADIFLTSRGRVTAVDSPGIPMSLFLEDWDDFPGMKSIITGAQAHFAGGIQFLHTLRDFIYVYVFSERMGQMTIKGMSFWDNCDAPNFHGIEYVYAYYLDNRASERATPIDVVIGLGTPFSGFLTEFDLDLSDPETLIAQFALKLNVVPEASILG